METTAHGLITQSELARRWGKSETDIHLCSAIGAAPRHLKIAGQIVYLWDEVRRYERACLFLVRGDVALREMQ